MSNFGRIITSDCIVPYGPPPPDTRCNDPAFALAHPELCPQGPQLILKPGVLLMCSLTSIQLRAVFVENGVETDVTNETVFQTSNPQVAVVGAFSGNVTALTSSTGTATISGAYNGLTAFSHVTVLGTPDLCCCEDNSVAMMVLVDQSHSMSQAFNASYATKLHYAKAAATRFISEVNEFKDTVGLMRFTDAATIEMSELTDDTDTVTALVPGILQTRQKTSFFDALEEAIEALDDSAADTKMIVVISDGFDTDPSYTDDSDNPILLLEGFKSGGGIVMCVGCRAHSRGYTLLSQLATGGFFINGYDGVEEEVLDYMSGLKGYVCAGNCTPTGDEYVPSGSLDYGAFANWSVTDGHVDLIGSGFMDMLPGNGLYVDMAGSTSVHKGRLLLKNPIAIEAGKMYRLSLQVAGNQRIDLTHNSLELKVFGVNNDGLEDPSTAPALNLIPAGGPITPETYRYAYSYVNAFGETNLSPSETNTVSNDTDGVDVSVPANPDAVLVRIWRTTGALPESRYYLIAELDPNSPVLIDLLRKAEMEQMISDGDIDESIMPPSSNTTGTPITILSQTLVVNDYRDEFRLYNYTFTATGDAEVYISIQQIETPSGHDAIGLLLGSVAFEDLTVGETLFEDDFDDENLTYVPPRCGIGTTYVPDGIVPYTEEVSNIVPLMTSNTEPSGEASASSESLGLSAYLAFDGDNLTYWQADVGVVDGSGNVTTPGVLQYEFASAKKVLRYHVTPRIAYAPAMPQSWTFEGSNDGSNWTVLDTQTEVPEGSWSASPLSFDIADPDTFLFYRINITQVYLPWITSGQLALIALQMDAEQDAAIVGYGYQVGYCCYGEGCLDEPPIAQLPDPNPLIDLEAGFTPPQLFTSTRTVCVECNEDEIPSEFTNLVPEMTSHTAPSGEASADSENSSTAFAWYAFDHSSGFTDLNAWHSEPVAKPSPHWLQYRFASAQTVGAYAITAVANGTAPRDWTLQGSNNGSTWTDLDTRSGISWFGFERKIFTISNTTSYLYYRLYITENGNQSAGLWTAMVQEWELFGQQPSSDQSCATATATSEISQADADAQAIALAQAEAQAGLECVQQFSSTECYTAHCPSYAFGPQVTKCATRTSLVSQAEADAAALAAAQELAEDELNCTMSNNTQRIELPDRVGLESARAVPYPSVKFVEGEVGLITKVTVTLHDFAHELYSDITIVLRSPSGTTVILMANCMNGASDAVERTFILDDDAADPIPEVTRPAGEGPHTYQPTVYGTPLSGLPSPGPDPDPGPGYSLTLAEFIGEDPNGSWSLWAVDIAGLDVGYLANGWDLTITVA